MLANKVSFKESVERILGIRWITLRHMGLALEKRLHSLKHSFQIHTLWYHSSILNLLFPDRLTFLSIYSGVGGAEITLNWLGIRLKDAISIEPSEPNWKILRWWENLDQTGELVQIATIQKLSSSKLGSLIDKFGVFYFIICQNHIHALLEVYIEQKIIGWKQLIDATYHLNKHTRYVDINLSKLHKCVSI